MQSLIMQKQGILPLWFLDKGDYNRIGAGDIVETLDLETLLDGGSGETIDLRVTKKNGDVLLITTKHTMSTYQLKWLREGSALNFIRKNIQKQNKLATIIIAMLKFHTDPGANVWPSDLSQSGSLLHR